MSDLLVTPELLSLLIAALVLFIGIFIVSSFSNKKQKISERLETQEKSAIDDILNDNRDSVTNKEGKKSWLKNKSLELEQAHTKMTLSVYIIILSLSIILIFAVSLLITNMFFLSVLISSAGILVPKKILESQREKNIDGFNTQFIKALKRISSVVRSGGTPAQGIKDVAENRTLPVNVRLEFKKVLWDMEYGKTIEEALYSLYERTGSEDVRDLSVVIEINRQTGGNLPLILDKKAKSITSRKLMESGVKTTLASARASANLLTIIFASMGGIIYLMSPSYFDELFNSAGGRLVLMTCISMEVVGTFVIRKMMKIKI